MLTIIGCGNLNRSDDGVGVVIAQRLAERLRRHPVPGVQVFDCGTAGHEVMFRARGSEALLILDACQSGSAPGTTFDVPGAELEQEHEPQLSLHDFRWDHALAAGRKIFGADFPKDVRVWLVEVGTMDLGLELGPEVAAAAEALYRQALQHIGDYAARRHDGVGPVRVQVRRGSIHLSKEVYDAYFDRRDGVLLFERDGRFHLLPVETTSGGILVKQRNLRGDRVIHAAEFLHEHGMTDVEEKDLPAQWDAELGALAVEYERPEHDPE